MQVLNDCASDASLRQRHVDQHDSNNNESIEAVRGNFSTSFFFTLETTRSLVKENQCQNNAPTWRSYHEDDQHRKTYLFRVIVNSNIYK